MSLLLCSCEFSIFTLQHTTTMKKIPTLLFSAVALLSAVVSPSLHAAILLDNTSAPLATGYATLWDTWVGLSFSTGSQVNTIRSLTLAPYSNGATQTGSITAELFAAGGDYIPTGSALASETFLGVLFGDTAAVWTETFTNTFTLNANSSYVLKLSNSVGADGLLGASDPSDGPLSTGTSGLTYNGRVFYSTWAGAALGPFATTQWVKLEGDSASAAVPEPGQVAASLLLLAGIGGYVFVKRRKTAKLAVTPITA